MRILYLAHRVPDAPTKGDKIRSFHELCALTARHEVHLFALDDEDPRERPPPAWRADVASATIVPLHPWGARLRALRAAASGGSLSAAHFAEALLKRRLRQALRERSFDAAVAYSGAVDPLLEGFRPRLLDLVDVDSAKFLTYWEQRTVGGIRRLAFGLEGRRLRALERAAAADADVTVVCTDREARTLAEFCRPRRLEVLGNGVDLSRYPFAGREGRDPATLLFVGALDYQANVDAVRFLVEELLPRIRQEVPGARVQVVGRNPARELRDLAARPGIELHANVESVVPFLQRATVALLPFRVARGIQNKALEALAAGLPVVCSTEAAEGLRGQAGTPYLVGQDASALAGQTARLLRQPALQEELAAAGRRLVEEEYSWDRILARFEALVSEIAAAPRATHA